MCPLSTKKMQINYYFQLDRQDGPLSPWERDYG
jgi:hypothetical protein